MSKEGPFNDRVLPTWLSPMSLVEIDGRQAYGSVQVDPLNPEQYSGIVYEIVARAPDNGTPYPASVLAPNRKLPFNPALQHTVTLQRLISRKSPDGTSTEVIEISPLLEDFTGTTVAALRAGREEFIKQKEELATEMAPKTAEQVPEEDVDIDSLQEDYVLHEVAPGKPRGRKVVYRGLKEEQDTIIYIEALGIEEDFSSKTSSEPIGERKIHHRVALVTRVSDPENKDQPYVERREPLSASKANAFFGTTANVLAQGERMYAKKLLKEERAQLDEELGVFLDKQLMTKHNQHLRQNDLAQQLVETFNLSHPEAVIDFHETTVCFVSLREPDSGEISTGLAFDSRQAPPIEGYEKFDSDYDEWGGVPDAVAESLIITIGFKNGEETRFVEVGDVHDIHYGRDSLPYGKAVTQDQLAITRNQFERIIPLAEEMLDHQTLIRKSVAEKMPDNVIQFPRKKNPPPEQIAETG
jgi:hypothetical protein